jgi:RNA polymerase sigma-70 factor (ECF subfamily)
LPSDSIHNENDLLRRIAVGDEQAFTTFYELHWQKVYYYLDAIVKSPEVAEELMTDIFIRLWDMRPTLAQIDNVGGFLRTMCRNKALDFLKITARDKKREQAYRAWLALRQVAGADDRLINDELKAIYQQAVAQLPPQRQKVFLLHREEGLSYKEIAESLHISTATVKKTMSEALESIRVYLHRHWKDELFFLAGYYLLDLLSS